jgi:superfamily II DNA helicase RecQ
VKARTYRILLTSPEMCFENIEFSKLLRDPSWSKYMMFVVIDEAHCIAQWGQGFRKMYSSLNKLRSYVPAGTPLLITSATLPPSVLSEIRNTLEVRDGQSLDLNLGNDRSNIMPIIWPMKGAREDLSSLDFVVTGSEVIPRTIIYVNKKDLARKVCEHLRKLVIPEMRSQIDFIHSGRSPGPQKAVLKRFQEGEVNVLCATEVVGMVRKFISKLDVMRCNHHHQGTDLKNVTLVVQFMVPSSLSVWVQRAGRAGRSGSPSCAVLLYELSVVKRVNIQEENEEDGDEDDQEWTGEDFKKRNVEDSLRSYVLTNKCRRLLMDTYFGNPPRNAKGASVFNDTLV